MLHVTKTLIDQCKRLSNRIEFDRFSHLALLAHRWTFVRSRNLYGPVTLHYFVTSTNKGQSYRIPSIGLSI